MRVLLPTIRDPDQIGGGGTHLTMLVAGLRELGHEAEALYLTATIPTVATCAGLVWPAGVLNRLRTGWGMVYSADLRGRLVAKATARELDRAGNKIAGTEFERTRGAAGAIGAGAGPWEVVNAQETYAMPHLRSVVDAHGVPLVLTVHGYPLYESVSEGYSAASRMGLHYLMRTEMRAFRLADAIVTVDTRLYHHVLGLVPERADTVYTLMNFIDTSRFAPPEDPIQDAELRRKLRMHWGFSQEKIILLCPRRLVKKNGVVYPALAIASMHQQERDTFLLLYAGEGGEREEIERIVAENRLEAHVRLLGGQSPEAVRELYRLADIVLVPSVHSENVEEATSLSALEAMASGRPLIAGNVGGLAEIVVDGETGLLVSGDAEALAAAILRLAAAPEVGARMAAAAREYVVAKHSHLRAAAAYIEVFRRVLGGTLGSRAAAAAGKGADGPLADSQPVQSEAPRWPIVSVLGFTLDVVTLEQAARWVIACAEREPWRPVGEPVMAGPGATARSRIAISFNPELVVRAQGDPFVAEALLHADLCYPDGVGAVWAAGRQGLRPRRDAEAAVQFEAAEGAEEPSAPTSVLPGVLERVPGIDLAARVLELAAERGLPVFFLGAGEGVAAEAAHRQLERLPGLRVAGTHHGYFDATQENEVVQTVRDSGARILLVAMGAPKQEVFLYRQANRLGAGVALGVGGSFDVWAGKVKRAPSWAQAARIEWLYRLLADPRRVRRQMALPRFAAKVMLWSPDDYGPPRRGRAAGTRARRAGATVAAGKSGSPGHKDSDP